MAVSPERGAETFGAASGSGAFPLGAWRRFANRLLADQGPRPEGEDWPHAGIAAVRSKDSYIHGLFCYRVVEDLRDGPSVCAHDFVALGLLHRAEAVATLVAALEQIAAAHGCAHVHVHLPEARIVPLPARDAGPLEAGGSVLRALQTHGFRCTSLRLDRPMTPLS
jgi:hypothetical protein